MAAMPALTVTGGAGAVTSGCWMAAVPSSGPVGTLVNVEGSTSGCNDGGSGGDPIFEAENASVSLGGVLPASGPFDLHFRVPATMASGSECCAAMQYEGGGPIAPGPTTFGVWQGADISTTFTVTSAATGWADFTAVATQPAACGAPGTCGGGSGPTGYLITRSGGFLDTFGNGLAAPGNAAGSAASPIVAAVYGPDQQGFWLLSSKGGVFSCGDVGFYGSAAASHLSSRFVAVVPSADFKGYWLVDSGGGVFPYGDAAFHGQARDFPILSPIVGMARTADGAGYWLASATGGVFSFGDAPFYGSMGGRQLNSPVVGITGTPDGHGYWLVAADGGVFSFGDAGFHGSAASLHTPYPFVGLARTLDGRGYWLLAQDGGVHTYGDASFLGSGRA